MLQSVSSSSIYDIKPSITPPGSSQLSLPSVSHRSPHLVLSVRMTQRNNEEDQTRTENSLNSTLNRPLTPRMSRDCKEMSKVTPCHRHDCWPLAKSCFLFLMSNNISYAANSFVFNFKQVILKFKVYKSRLDWMKWQIFRAVANSLIRLTSAVWADWTHHQDVCCLNVTNIWQTSHKRQ